jgi:hypothetical protein
MCPSLKKRKKRKREKKRKDLKHHRVSTVIKKYDGVHKRRRAVVRDM